MVEMIEILGFRLSVGSGLFRLPWPLSLCLFTGGSWGLATSTSGVRIGSFR